jgi:hypothetical protein
MDDQASKHESKTNPAILFVAWLAVGVPLLWGVALTVTKAAALFR